MSIFDKIFEKILCKRLISFLERNKLLYCHQYGFRKFYSTFLALIEVTDLVKRYLDEKQNVVGIFIDFRKAFDTVNHDILLDKLECYGIRGHASKFFRSYLTNRHQYTLVNGIKSNCGYVNCGVPQGSVLGPLSFLLYINDIKHAIGCDNVKLFADDTFLFTNDRNVMPQKKKQAIYLKKFPAGVLPTNYRLTARRRILCSFIQRISRFRNTLIVYRQRFLTLIELHLSNI